MRLPDSPLRRIAAAAAALALLAAGPAMGQGSNRSKLYAGVGLAVADFEGVHGGIGYDATPPGLQLYGGYQARELLGLELAIDHLAGIEPGELLGSGVERLRISAEHSSFTLRGVLSLSLREILRRRPNVKVLATVGAARSIEKRSVLELTTQRLESASERDTAVVLGAGVTFELERVHLRTFLQSADRRHGTLNSVGVAAELRF